MATSKLRFSAPIEIRGINPYVHVSAERTARLKPDWRKPMPVRIQVNGKPDVHWRINMMPAGDGSFFLYLHAQVRNASSTAVGDVVSVTIDLMASTQAGRAIQCRPGSAINCGEISKRGKDGSACHPAGKWKSSATWSG
jgi:hypothetical protein